eukprot:TRINITY_DN5120_c0_g1_i1.p2 TRINITY_DN5120_c0_g1~~TRINITY_DN5120_c0_g1_i1.p2  ORF type:complete len:194 (+),score=56.56 TRINITY_DN5120_c0_g1_i1:137-718(+)
MAVPVPKRQPGHSFPGGDSGPCVTLEFFADVQCPYCAKVWPTLQKVMEHYRGRIRFAVTPYVVAGHNQAWDVHRALEVVSRVAGPGQYFDFLRFVFASQQQFSNATFKTKTPMDLLELLSEWTEQFGVPPGKLGDLMETDDTFDAVRAAQRRGISLGVWSTPTFFINGALVTRVTGSCDVAQWIEYLDSFDLR